MPQNPLFHRENRRDGNVLTMPLRRLAVEWSQQNTKRIIKRWDYYAEKYSYLLDRLSMIPLCMFRQME